MSFAKLSDKIESLDLEEKETSSERESANIILTSKQGVSFKVSRKDACISDLVKTAIEGDKEATEIPVNISSEMLGFVVEYMNLKKGATEVVVSKPLKPTLEDSCTKEGRWEAEFVNRVASEKKGNRDELVLVANYMAINSLLHIACARVAIVLKGKSKDGMIKAIKDE